MARSLRAFPNSDRSSLAYSLRCPARFKPSSKRAIEARGSSNAREIVVHRSHRRHGVFVGDLFESDETTEPRLAEPPDIGLNDGGDLRITAGRVGIAQLDDRLAGGRY